MHGFSRNDIVGLSPQERIALIGELWDSLSDSELSLSHAQSAELDRRLGSFDADLEHCVSWDVLKAELAARTR